MGSDVLSLLPRQTLSPSQRSALVGMKDASELARALLLLSLGAGEQQAVSVTTSSLSIDKVMLCVKTDSPGVLRAGAGECLCRFLCTTLRYMKKVIASPLIQSWIIEANLLSE